MSSKQDIWMPLYIADYLADTTRLNTEQHGAYLLIIMDYWRNGAPPDNDEVLANITRLPQSQWRKHKPVLAKLFNIKNSEWHHKRIDEELINAQENAKKYAERAKKAADKRWQKDALSNATSITNSNKEALLGDMLADATSPSPTSTDISNSSENTTIPNVEKNTQRTLASEICIELTKLQLPPFNRDRPDFLKLVELGATVEEFVNTALEIKSKNKSKFNFEYLVSVVAGRRKDAASMGNLHQGAMPAQTSREAGRNAAAKSVFKTEHIQHLMGGSQPTEIEVKHG